MSLSLSILYHIRKAKGKSDGLASIYCRITVDGSRAEMSISPAIPEMILQIPVPFKGIT